MCRLSISIILLCLFQIATAQADVVLNGGFESGLANWSAAGDVLAVGAGMGSGPVQGAGQALLTTASLLGDGHNFSGSDAAAVGALEAFLGLAPGSLDALAPAGAAVEGSALRQTFTAQAGDKLSFHYNFLTTEPAANNPNPDLAFLLLNNTFHLLATTASPLSPPPSPSTPSSSIPPSKPPSKPSTSPFPPAAPKP